MQSLGFYSHLLGPVSVYVLINRAGSEHIYALPQINGEQKPAVGASVSLNERNSKAFTSFNLLS